MQIIITEEAHNRIRWEVRTPLVRLLLALLGGWIFLSAIALSSNSAARGWLAGAVTALILGGAVILALRLPLRETGFLERPTVGGGELNHQRRRLLTRTSQDLTLPLESVRRLYMETRTFEETAGRTHTLARLWIVPADAAPINLTPWGTLEEVRTLALALTKAGHLPFEGQAENK